MADTVRIEIPIEVIDDTEPELSKISDGLEDLGKTANKTKDSVEKASKKVTGFDESANKTQRTLSNWMKEKYQLLLDIKDKVSPVLNELKPGLKSLVSKSWSVTMEVKDLVTAPVRGIIDLLKDPVFQVGAVLGVSISLKDTVDTYADFEATMSEVKALSDANKEEMEQLTEKAKEMGSQTKYSGTESAEAFTYMAQAGWQVKDMINGIGGVMSLAAADGLDLATTTDIVSNALTAFKMNAEDSAEFADVLAIASSATNTNVYELGEAFKYIAPVAGAMGYSIQDASMALGLMSNNAVKGSMAGTALKTSLANMAAPTDNMAAAMEKYGISLTDNEGNMKTLKDVIDNLRSSLGGLSEVEQTAAASTIFGKEAMAGMLAIINTTEEDYKKLTEAINNSEGAADRMASTMQDNLKGSLEELGGAVETVQLSWGEQLKPYITSLADMLQDNMPAIEEFGLQIFDALDKKIKETKEKIDTFTNTDAWAKADIFGKMSISWDELIAQPFIEWWDSKGHDLFVGKAGSIGRWLGTAVSTGILALLGVDVSSAIDEGSSVGSAFAKGLIAGFDVDALQEKLWESITGIFSNASKIFPGGEEADLSSWMSAALIAKFAAPLIGGGVKTAKLGKMILGSGEGELGLGSTIIGSAAKGTGLKGLGVKMGMLGMNLGSGATSGAGLIATGAAAATGGVIGGATLISSGVDLYKGFTSKDNDEAAAYKESGAWKIGGVAAGAATGAAVGSFIPVVGTAAGALIGAGVGGIAGWIKGDSAKKEYEENLKKAQEEAAALALAEEQAKYESQELKDALANASMTAEEFGQLFQKEVGNNLKKHFGDIVLSMKEIEDIAKKLTFGDNIESISKFEDAVSETEQAYSKLEDAISNMDKLSWKASLGLELDDSEIQEYIYGIEDIIQSATDYLQSEHYEIKTAIDLLVDTESDIDFKTGLDSAFLGLQEQINTIGSDLTAKVNIFLEDGVITLDEQAEITSLQNQITEITQKVADIQTEAEFKALKIKYSGAALDADSFAEMQAELKEQVESATSSYDEALKVGIASLEFQLDEGAISKEQYNEQLQALADGYEAKISDMSVKVENFQLETIADAYSKELDNILPELSGSTAEKLQTALHDAIASGVDVSTWDTETASQWLGLDGLSLELQAAITELMSRVADTIPQSLQEQIIEGFSDTQSMYSNMDFIGPFSNEFYEQMSTLDLSSAYVPLFDELSTGLPSKISALDYSKIGVVVGKGVESSIKNTDMAPINSAISLLKENTGLAIDKAFSSGFNTTIPVSITANYKLVNPLSSMDFSGPSFSASQNIAKNANGSIVNGPLLSWVGEDGPEAIIPLGAKRRGRGLSLWEKAGELLGVKKYANGGIIGNSINAISNRRLDESNKFDFLQNLGSGNKNIEKEVSTSEQTSTHSNNSIGNQATDVKIDITVNPSFQISSENMNESDIVRVIKEHMKELADEIGGELAGRLDMVFSNMPLKGEV